MAFKMKASPEGPMKKNFPSVFKNISRAPSAPGRHNWRHNRAGGSFSDEEHNNPNWNDPVEEEKEETRIIEKEIEEKEEMKEEK